MIMLIITRLIWWAIAGLCFGTALCGFWDSSIILSVPGIAGTLWFLTCALLPDRILTRRERLYEQPRAATQRSIRAMAVRDSGDGSHGGQSGRIHQLYPADSAGRTVRLHGPYAPAYREPDGPGGHDRSGTDRTRYDIYRID